MSPPKKLFEKLLVANRGEIACRVFDTCRRLGIQTVAIFSEKDVDAKHVHYADEAYCVGPAESAKSYLNMDAIMDVIQQSGAGAVHPGYGFLSENADFSSMLADNGVAFLGPDRLAIEAMGDKIESKRIALNAGVNCIPGIEGEVETTEAALAAAQQVGYPIMLKASAGGGGKGMRMARNDQETIDGFKQSREEAMASFGDDRMLIERFVERPRHIEIQIVMDRHGNGVYLNERDCSVQRRNQKVLEEAPSTFLDEATRQAMGEQALALGRSVDYCSAGTVEFIVDPDRNFFFLEMNTRLQVEHPVTELITGVDLVEQMIRVGAGEELSITQDDIPRSGGRGWAVEARVYAENPENDFLPSIGRVHRYEEPPGSSQFKIESAIGGIRCDSGISEGSDISVYYDPMICKLIAHADTREEACAKLTQALDEYVIRGVTHNVPFLRDCLNHPKFLEGDISTAFIEEHFPDGYSGARLDTKAQANLAAVGAALYYQSMRSAQDGAEAMGDLLQRGGEPDDGCVVSVQLSSTLCEGSEASEEVTYLVFETEDGQVLVAESGSDGKTGTVTTVELEPQSEALQLVTMWVDGVPVVDAATNPAAGATGEGGDDEDDLWGVAPKPQALQLHRFPVAGAGGGAWTVQYQGAMGDVSVRPLQAAKLEAHMPAPVEIDTHKFVLSPMPGSLISLAVQPGDVVVPGQEIACLEAMKMRNVIRAERGGVVKALHANVGDTLQPEDFLVEFEDEGEDEEVAG